MMLFIYLTDSSHDFLSHYICMDMNLFLLFILDGKIAMVKLSFICLFIYFHEKTKHIYQIIIVMVS